jgi:uncharacterized membrane protein YqjE
MRLQTIQPEFPPADGVSMATVDASYTDLLQRIVVDLQDLMRSELRLLKAEFREDIKAFKVVATLIGTGGLILLFATFFALCSIVLALTIVMPAWAAALIVAITLGIAGGLTLRAGIRQAKQANLGPDRTVQSLKEIAQ